MLPDCAIVSASANYELRNAQLTEGRAQPPVNFDCQSWRTTSVEHATSKSAGGEHVPPVGGLGELTQFTAA